MSEIKHTPGPWILATVPTSVGSCHKIGPFPGAGHRPHTFACVYADGIRVGIDEALPAAIELAANARLIAAAPELLEALKATNSAAHEALIVLRDVLRDDARFDDLIRTLDNATDVGYAAIAKAEGQS